MGQQPNEDDRREAERRAEMERNYPVFRKFVYDTLKAEFLRTTPELPAGVDLESYARELGALPLESFIDELRRPKDGAAG